MGDWAHDCYPGARGSFFVHDGAGPGVEFGGESGPFYLSIEGICFVGNPASQSGVRIVGRSSMSFSRCGWTHYYNVRGDGALHLTRAAQDFVGVISVSGCWFANGVRGVVIDRPLTNVINIDDTKFIDVSRCIDLVRDCSVRSLNIGRCHFESHNHLRCALGVDGTVYALNFTGNYIEQNSTQLNEPLIDIAKRRPGEISRGVVIEGNFIQKMLGAQKTAIIRLAEVQRVSVRSNVTSAGNADDRYWCVIAPGVVDAYIEPPATPNGVAPYPVLNMRTGRAYKRAHWSEEAKPLPQLRLGGEARGVESATAALALFTDREGEVTVDFDLSATLRPRPTGRLEIVGLPSANGQIPGAVTIHSATGFTDAALPLQGYVAPNERSIRLVARSGEEVRLDTHAAGALRIRGRAIYERE